jgi:hypothetical protein
MPKKHIADHFAEWMKRVGERLSDLESNYKVWIRGMRSCIRAMRSSARKWMSLRVSWRLRIPASMISRAKTASLKNHRRTGRESRGGPCVRSKKAHTGRPSSDCSRIEPLRWAEASGSTR